MRISLITVVAWSLLLASTAGAQQAPPATAGRGDNAMLVEKDYDALTGRWQLVKSVVDGKPVPEEEVRKTILITDHDTFRFPADAGVGTAPLGHFTIDPTKNPKQVDSTALSGPDKGKVTYGIYEILDANNKRACWVRPGEPRPTDLPAHREAVAQSSTGG